MPIFLPKRGIYFCLFSFDEFEEFVDVLDGIIILLFVFLAARAVMILLSLIGQVFNDSLQLGRKVSLRTKPLKGFYLLGEFLPIEMMLVLVLFLSRPGAHKFLITSLFFHLDEFSLMASKLVL